MQFRHLFFTFTLSASAAYFSGCATPYQEMSMMTLTGGYYDEDLGEGVWRVGFSGNGYTTDETVQTLWLYRCAELALEEGYDGFEILSDIRLSKLQTPEELFEEGNPNVHSAQYYVPESYKPSMEGDIILLKAPIAAIPPRVFDARKLKAALEPHLPDKSGNVEPHRHEYIYRKKPQPGA